MNENTGKVVKTIFFAFSKNSILHRVFLPLQNILGFFFFFFCFFLFFLVSLKSAPSRYLLNGQGAFLTDRHTSSVQRGERIH